MRSLSSVIADQANKSDGWDTEPFKLVVDEQTGRLIGRGSTDDKGPILGWLNVLEAHKTLGIELPVNMRFCFEGMEENGSEGLDDLIKTEVTKGKESWFDGVDCVCIVRPQVLLRQDRVTHGPHTRSRTTTG